MIKTIDHRGPLKVVKLDELEVWTTAGWRLVAMYQESGQFTSLVERTEEEPTRDGSYGTVLCKRYHPSADAHTHTFFLLQEDEESATARLWQDLEVLKAKNQESEAERERLIQAARERSKEMTEQERVITQQNEKLNQRNDLIDKRTEQLDKMERDIAALRRVFGEKAITEALADDWP